MRDKDPSEIPSSDDPTVRFAAATDEGATEILGPENDPATMRLMSEKPDSNALAKPPLDDDQATEIISVNEGEEPTARIGGDTAATAQLEASTAETMGMMASTLGGVIPTSLSQLESRVNREGIEGPVQDGNNLAAEIEDARRKQLLVRDRFILMKSLGAGGMGAVFMARDTRREEAGDSNSKVAIKFLNANFGQHSSALVSLQREARKTQELAHPNIVTVYDFDRDNDKVFMTMELLDGEALSKLEKLEEELGEQFDRVNLLCQIAEGVAYAHSRHYVHSDLKPDNVFVTRKGRAKVLDFGIARMTAEAEVKDSFDAGSLGALTKRYASVEMLRGNNEPHPSDDVYALGLIGWRLFTGEHPYGGKNALDALEQGLQPGSLPALKGRQRRALIRAVALDRDKRQQDATEFLAEFAGPRNRNRLLAALAMTIAVVSGAWIYTASLPEGPEVPFESLPETTQTAFNDAIARGDLHAEITDWDGALTYYIEAWELHPRNPHANAALDRIAEQLLAIETGIESADSHAYAAAVNRLMSNEYLAERDDLRDLQERWSQ